jgi:chorismate mutase
MRNLDELRGEIDVIDEELVRLIARRKVIALEIAKFKKENGGGGDSARIEKVLERVGKVADEEGLPKEAIQVLWANLIKLMIKEQMKEHPYETDVDLGK